MVNLTDYCASDNNTTFDLNQIQFTTEMGEWTIDRPGDIDISGDQILVDATTAPGTYTLVYTLTTTPPSPCSASSVPISFEVFQQPFAEVANSVSSCNSGATGEPTDLDLNAQITAGDNTGTWSHNGAGPAVNGTSVDFDGVALGDYTYEYTLDVQAGSPCMPLQLMTTVRVIDCNCPDISIMPLDDLCTSGTTINLNTFLNNPDNQVGTWSVNDPNGIAVPGNALIGDRFQSDNLDAGTYTATYSLITPIVGCDLINTVTQDIVIHDEPEASLAAAIMNVCNAEDDMNNLPFIIDLDTLLMSGSGDWSVGASFPGSFDEDENIVDFTGVPPDTYEIVFTTDNALAPCDEVDLPLEVNVAACGCPMFLFTTPGEFCTTDGRIDLDQFITNIDDLPDGEWFIISGSSDPNLDGSEVNLTNYVTGPYEYQYRLGTVPMGCTVRNLNVVINVIESVEVVIEPLVSPCNVIQNDGSHCINLNDLVEVIGGTGTWTVDPFYIADGGDGSDVTNICFDGLGAGTAYNFSFTAMDDNGMCLPVTELTTVFVSDCSCPNVDLNPTDLLCQGETLDLTSLESTLTADGDWSASQGGTSIPLQNNILETAGLEGVIDLTFTPTGSFDPACQPGLTTVEIFVAQSAGVATPVEFCSGQAEVVDLFGQLTGADPGGVWTEASTNPFQDGFDDIAGTFNTEFQRSGVYEFMYTTEAAGSCPADEEVVSINLLFNPIADAGEGGVITCNSSVELGGPNTTVGGDFTHIWTATDGGSLTVDDQPLVMVSQPGTYTLVVTDANGCTSEDTAVVTSDGGLTAGLDINEPDCPGEFGQAIVTTTNGAGTVLFSIDNGANFQESDMFNNLPAGPHSILVTDDNGCEILLDFVIPEPDILNVDSGEDREVDLGDSLYIISAALAADIDPATIELVTWVDSESGTVLCSGPLSLCRDIEVDPVIFNEYCVTIVNNEGCEATDCVILREQLVRDVFIPTIFNPNADNPADRSFFVQADRFVEAVEEMGIYDRWGQLVYSIPGEVLPNDPAAGWNGRWGNTGGLLEQGVYVYFIRVRYSSFENMPDTCLLYTSDAADE